jgi:hypothetical protein
LYNPRSAKPRSIQQSLHLEFFERIDPRRKALYKHV